MTREAQLEAAAKNLVWAAQTSGGTAGRDEGLVAACDRMTAALSTPATEPQGYVEGVTGFGASYRRDDDCWMIYSMPGAAPFARMAGFDNSDVEWALTALRQALAARPAPQPAAEPVAYLHTRDEGQSKELVLAERVNSETAQRRIELGWVSVPLYTRPQPAADTRVVPLEMLELWEAVIDGGKPQSLRGLAEQIRAIIGEPGK